MCNLAIQRITWCCNVVIINNAIYTALPQLDGTVSSARETHKEGTSFIAMFSPPQMPGKVRLPTIYFPQKTSPHNCGALQRPRHHTDDISLITSPLTTCSSRRAPRNYPPIRARASSHPQLNPHCAALAVLNMRHSRTLFLIRIWLRGSLAHNGQQWAEDLVFKIPIVLAWLLCDWLWNGRERERSSSREIQLNFVHNLWE